SNADMAPMARLRHHHRAGGRPLSAAMVVALAAAHELDASIALSRRDVGLDLKAAAGHDGVPFHVLWCESQTVAPTNVAASSNGRAPSGPNRARPVDPGDRSVSMATLRTQTHDRRAEAAHTGAAAHR
ncbi:MAG: hypothetical protein ACRDYZ_13790, partial [Acidimicrobiales bacterium]